MRHSVQREVHAASEACRLAAEGMPFPRCLRAVARQLQDGSFKPVAVTASSTVPELDNYP